ncbi:MAG: apolipoprotein N-acyltransferase [Candidatus Omnitrophota bacterium]
MIIRTFFLCILSSLLLLLSFPKFNLEFLAWFSFIPLLFAIENKTKRAAFWLSYSCGFVFFISILYWLVHVTLIGLIILSIYLAFYFAFFGYFFVGFRRRLPKFNFLIIIFLSSIWVILEYLRSQLLSGFPWALLGYSQYLNIGLIQIVDITGSFGISFLIVFVNLYLFEIIKSISSKEFKLAVRILLILFLIFAVIYSYGSYAINKYSDISKTVIKVSLLQGNIPQEAKWESVFRTKIKQIYFDLTQETVKDNPDLIIWPETAYPDYFSSEDRIAYNTLIQLARKAQRPILFGAVLEQQNKYFNSAVLIPADLSRPIFYKKIHLVPFGEYLPLRQYLPFMEKFVPIEDFDAGKEFVVFKTKNSQRETVSFGALICFEDIIFELARQLRLNGADFLVNITNDAWFKDTSSPYQHMQASVFRALENRVYVLRSANTGITCIIDNCGRIVNRVKDKNNKDTFVKGFISGEVKKQDTLSIYSRFGDILILACAIYILWFALFPAKKQIHKARKYYFSRF